MGRRTLLLIGLAAGAAGMLALLGGRAAGQVETDTVLMEDFEFRPAEITVTLGATVVWEYNDAQCDLILLCPGHNTVSEDGHWESETWKGEGETFAWTADVAGRHPYLCTIHAGEGSSPLTNMVGVLNVTAPTTVVAEPPTTDPTATTAPGAEEGAPAEEAPAADGDAPGAAAPEAGAPATAAPATAPATLPATGGDPFRSRLAGAVLLAAAASVAVLALRRRGA